MWTQAAPLGASSERRGEDTFSEPHEDGFKQGHPCPKHGGTQTPPGVHGVIPPGYFHPHACVFGTGKQPGRC